MTASLAARPRLGRARLRPALGAWFGLAGIALAFLAAFADGTLGDPTLTLALYAVAAVAAAFSFSVGPGKPRQLAGPVWALRLPHPKLLALAVALHIAALVLLARGRVGVGSLLWMLALVLLPFAFVEAVRLAMPLRIASVWTTSCRMMSCRAALSFGAVTLWDRSLRGVGLGAANGRALIGEVVTVVALLAIGAAFRFYALADYPTGIHGDEAEFGMLSVGVLRGVRPYPFGVVFLGDPALFVYVNALGIALLGQTIEAIRSVAAAGGWLSLLPLYWLTRQMFGVPGALAALAFAATNYLQVHFSRMALNVPEVMFLTTLAFACLWAGLARGRPVWYVLAGIFGGLDLYFHFGARPLPLIFGAVFLAILAVWPAYRRLFWLPTGLTMLGAVAALGPAIWFFAHDPAAFSGHAIDRFIFTHWDSVAGAYNATDWGSVFWGQTLKNVLIFARPVPGTMFYPAGGDAAFVAPVTPLVLLGLGVAAFRSFDPRFGLLALWFVGFLAAGILSVDAPQPHRLVALLPAVAICAGAVAGRFVALGELVLGRRGRAVAAAGLVGLVAATAVDDAQAFFVRSAGAYPWSDSTLQARYIAAQPPDTTVLVAATPYMDAHHGTTRYLAGSRGPRDIKNLSIDLALLDGETSALTFVVNKGLSEWLPVIRAYFPGGVGEPLVDGRGDLQLIGYRLEETDLPRRAAVDLELGLRLTVTPRRDAGRAPIVRTDPVVAYRDAAVLADRQPYEAIWRGELLPRRLGEYRVEVAANGPVQLAIGGRTVLERTGPGDSTLGAQVRLDPRQPIELRYAYRDGPGVVELYWQPPGASRELIPPDALRPPPDRL